MVQHADKMHVAVEAAAEGWEAQVKQMIVVAASPLISSFESFCSASGRADVSPEIALREFLLSIREHMGPLQDIVAWATQSGTCESGKAVRKMREAFSEINGRLRGEGPVE